MTYPTIKRLTEDKAWFELPEHIDSWLMKHAPFQYHRLLADGKPTFFRGIKRTRPSGKTSRFDADSVIISPEGSRPSTLSDNKPNLMLAYFNPDWPDRSRSTLCSKNASVAMGYGEVVYAIIPPDETMVAAFKTHDDVIHSVAFHRTKIWGQMSMVVQQCDGYVLDNMYDTMSEIGNWTQNQFYNAGKFNDPAKLVQFVDDIVEEFTGKITNDVLPHLTDDQRTRVLGGDLPIKQLMRSGEKYSHLIKRLNLCDLSFEADLKMAREMRSGGDGECWFEGPFVAVDDRILSQLRAQRARTAP